MSTYKRKTISYNCAWCPVTHRISKIEYAKIPTEGSGTPGVTYKQLPCKTYQGKINYHIHSSSNK